MFSRVALFALLALPAFSIATPLVARGGGSVQCCNNVEQAGDYSAHTLELFKLLGIDAGGVNVPVGITCTGVNVIGLGGTKCTSQEVNCKDNSFNGVVALGCTPVNVGI